MSCNYIYRELKERLPEVFYPLRRGYLVNTLYIVALRRFEAELISGISIPIPALTYTGQAGFTGADREKIADGKRAETHTSMQRCKRGEQCRC